VELTYEDHQHLGGPRGPNTKSGPVLVEAGQTADVDIGAAEKRLP
jgi:hypothetical protein